MSNLPARPEPMLSEADYEAIESAVMETARGRWFLSEYARRNRHADTTMLLTAIERIESVVRGGRANDAVDRLRFDLVDMAKAIARTKAEIAAIKPDADRAGNIGVATEELDSIVGATETATSDILAAAEQIQETAWSLRERGVEMDACDALDAHATEIYTACSFQDLTGQRTRKVIQVLHYLEERIDAMIGIWELDEGPVPPPPMHPKADGHAESGRHLLNGPARPGEGLDQSDVDMVMGPAAARDRDGSSGSHGLVIDADVLDHDDIGSNRSNDFERDHREEQAAEPVAAAHPEAPEPRAAVPEAAATSDGPAPDPATAGSQVDSAPLNPIMALSREERRALFA